VHEWFRQLGIKKGINGCENPDTFSGVAVPIKEEDITQLINDLCDKNMAYTTEGFFFGSDSEMNDLEFSYYMYKNFENIANMLEELEKGNSIYYDSSW
jgi:hypothetical protein